MSNETVFTADNRYRPEHGEPPRASRKKYYFSSYFENRYGDQLMFLYDKDKAEAYIYNGRAGWDQKTVVPREDIKNGSFEVHFNQFDGEERWIESCIISLQPRFDMQYDGYDGDEDDEVEDEEDEEE